MNQNYQPRASEDALAELHGMMANYFKEAILQSKQTGEPLSPSLLNTVRQYLKDNAIDCVGRNNGDMATIVDNLPIFDEDATTDSTAHRILQ